MLSLRSSNQQRHISFALWWDPRPFLPPCSFFLWHCKGRAGSRARNLNKASQIRAGSSPAPSICTPSWLHLSAPHSVLLLGVYQRLPKQARQNPLYPCASHTSVLSTHSSLGHTQLLILASPPTHSAICSWRVKFHPNVGVPIVPAASISTPIKTAGF